MYRTARAAAALAAAAAAILGGLATAAPAQADACPYVTPYGTVSPAPYPGVNWAGCDLSGGNLSGADLRGAHVAGAKLTGAKLTGARIDNIDLSGASGVGADLTDAVGLTGTNLSLAHLEDATFTRTILTGANLGEAYLDGAAFDGVDARGANLGWATMTGAQIRRSDFTGATAVFVTLQGATIDGSTFTSSDLRTAWFSAATTITGSSFDEANLNGATFLDAVTASGNTWLGATCPDGKPSSLHAAVDCVRQLDTSPPMSLYPTVTGPGTGIDHWYTGPVTVHWNWLDGDGLTRPDACKTSTTMSATGNATASCTDTAGNVGTASLGVTVRVDATKPTAAVNLSTLNSYGAQYPKCTGADTGGSGLVSCAIATTASSDRNYRYAVATAKDKAGNTTTTSKVRYRATTVAAWTSVPSTKTHGYRFTVYLTAKNAKGYLINVSPVRAFKPVKVTSTGSGPANTTWGSYFTKVSTGTYKLTLTAPSTRGYYRYAVRVGNATITKVIRVT